MRVPRLLILDFDGVICDSIDECFAASCSAYHGLYHKKRPAAEPPEAARREFARLRPFIRTGEDFVLIQELLAAGGSVRDQAGFDDASRRAGAEKRALYRELFYRARTELLERDRETWLALNRIYPHMAIALARLPAEAPLWILSTKEPRFIVEILSAHRLEVPEKRIVLSEGEPKLAAAERLRIQGSFDAAMLVEDQIDHLRGNANDRVQPFLAAWGYVQPEWLREPAGIPLLTPEGFLELVDREYGRR